MILSRHTFTVFYFLFVIIAAIERINKTFFNEKTKPTKVIYYKWTFPLLVFSYFFCVVSSIYEYFFSVRTINIAVSIFGAGIYMCGMLLRRKAIAALGSNWSFHIEIKERHELINDGIYKVIRHPYYLAVILELAGVCFVANAFYSLIVVFLIQGPLLIIRLVLEEQILKKYLDFNILEKNKKNL